MIYNEEAKKSIELITEAYFGRTPEIEAIIKQIGIIREKAGVKIGEKAPLFNKYNPAINTWPEMIKLNRLIEDCFGFDCAAISVDQNAQMNAYTFPISYSFDATFFKNPKTMIISSKNGFKYKKEAKYCLWVNITSGLLLNSEITNEEITAVLLHEIGHNFSTAMDNSVGGMILIRNIYYIISYIIDAIIKLDPVKLGSGIGSIITNENWYKRLSTKLDEVTNDFFIFRGFKVFRNVLLTILNACKTIANDVFDAIVSFNPILVLAGVLGSTAKWPDQIINTCLGGNKDEQFADSFPGMYGLGNEQATALAKMTTGNQGFALYEIVHNTPVIGHIANTIQFPIVFMASLFDAHPNLEQRFKFEIDLLENELAKTNLDPKMRVSIKRQLNEIKKDHEKYCSSKSAKELGDPRIVQRTYEEWLANSMNGGARSNIFDNKSIFTKIDDTYDKNRIDKVKFK